MSKSIHSTTTEAGGWVTYSITLINSGGEAAQCVSVHDALPAGFRYCHGTSVITTNGAVVSTSDPSISCRTLMWAGLQLPTGRSDSYLGIHTFQQRHSDSDAIDCELDSAAELLGGGAHVIHLLDCTDPGWHGSPEHIRDFAIRAHDRSLTLVISLALVRSGEGWYEPKPDSDRSYSSRAQGFNRVVEGLPRRDSRPLCVHIGKEPNLNEEWEGQASFFEYVRFLVDSAAAIRPVGDPRIVMSNEPLSAGGDYYYLDYLDGMLANVPAALWAFEAWAGRGRGRQAWLCCCMESRCPGGHRWSTAHVVDGGLGHPRCE
ncbi:MAG TPA: hypothetical protein VMY98_02470 [Anaerolineae bacterium]|nr:hypothetical protein [Anaerolineae bacterium]